ncbi:MAG: PHP domain-containing protein [Clostridiales bacterium]|nr:PHP domain-containing protein [Clostridiales bacterium]
MKCDLHIHTNCSDGLFAPEAIVEMAKERGLDCIAITDHDTFQGVERARGRAHELGLKYVVGAEISSVLNGLDVHMLAYNVDIDNPEFRVAMERISDLRNQRNIAIVGKLHEHGIDIDLDALKQKVNSVGRAVIAREMVRLGAAKDVADAFERYVGTGKCCFVQTRRLTPVEVVRFTLQFGGIPVLAHPKQLHMNEREFEEFLKPLVKAGLAGIEANYFTHNMPERNFYNKMAKKYKLIVTGGSDFHDYVHGVELGTKSFSPNVYTRKILGI